MVKTFCNPEDIPSSIPITEEHFNKVENAIGLIYAYQPTWWDIEALFCFFTHCALHGDRHTFGAALERVQLLSNEVKESGWNDDRVLRCKALLLLEKEIYEVYPHLFNQEFDGDNNG